MIAQQPKPAPVLKWEVRQRLTLLEATAFWSGELATNFLTETFAISRVQATKDIGLYLSLRPNNLRYDLSLKRYRITEQFQPLFISGSPLECLQVLQARGDSAAPVVTLISNLPPVEVMVAPSRLVDIAVLRPVLQAARGCQPLEIVYQSMNRAEPSVRVILPHTLVFDGLRWHVRSYSQSHGEFRDFVLARMHGVKPLPGKAGFTPPEDALWNTWLTVEIGPHPGLSPSQKSAVERDYGMADGRLASPVRAALLPYFLQTLRIGPDDMRREAVVQQIVLLNRAELQAYIAF